MCEKLSYMKRNDNENASVRDRPGQKRRSIGAGNPEGITASLSFSLAETMSCLILSRSNFCGDISGVNASARKSGTAKIQQTIHGHA